MVRGADTMATTAMAAAPPTATAGSKQLATSGTPSTLLDYPTLAKFGSRKLPSDPLLTPLPAKGTPGAHATPTPGARATPTPGAHTMPGVSVTPAEATTSTAARAGPASAAGGSMASRLAAQRQARSAARTGSTQKRRSKQRLDASGALVRKPPAAPPPPPPPPPLEVEIFTEELERADREARQRLIDGYLNLPQRG